MAEYLPIIFGSCNSIRFEKGMCLGNGSENFRMGRHTYSFLIIYFFLEKSIILSILKMHKIIF